MTVRDSSAAASVRSDQHVVVALADVAKRYGEAWVLRDASLELRAGEIHALCGENGAGKSTLVRIIGGVIQPDRGTVYVDGHPIQIGNAAQARQRGIAVIHQHPALFPDLSVAENVFLASDARRGFALVRRRRAEAVAGRILEGLGVAIDPGRLAGTLSVADQQLVEIAKALHVRPSALILDEPTASLTPHEVDRLFEIMRELRTAGAAILMVNHRLAEVFEVSDHLTVMRNGEIVSSAPTHQYTRDAIVRHMVGHALDVETREGAASSGHVVLDVRALTRVGEFRDVSFEVRQGEILGMAGLVGAGRTEILETVFGLRRPTGGNIFLDGEPVSFSEPADAIRKGLAFVPEDRHQSALALSATVRDNIAINSVDHLRSHGLMSRSRETSFAEEWTKRLRIQARSTHQETFDLSGGNQQKVVLAKWLSGRPSVLLLDEPTFGVDVGAQEEIHQLIRALADQGAAVLVVSSDVMELISLAHRVLVVHEGRIVRELVDGEINEVNIVGAAVDGAGR